MSRRRARSNPSLTVEQWLLVTGGVAFVGIGAWLVFRKPAATPQQQQLIDAQAAQDKLNAANAASSQAGVDAINKAFVDAAPQTPPPGGSIFGGFDPNAVHTYNPGGAQLGDPNDPNSAAAACILAHQYAVQIAAGNRDPGLVRVADELAQKCVAAGGAFTW